MGCFHFFFAKKHGIGCLSHVTFTFEEFPMNQTKI